MLSVKAPSTYDFSDEIVRSYWESQLKVVGIPNITRRAKNTMDRITNLAYFPSGLNEPLTQNHLLQSQAFQTDETPRVMQNNRTGKASTTKMV